MSCQLKIKMQFKKTEGMSLFPQKELDLDLASHMSYGTIKQLSKTEKGKTPLRLWFEKREHLWLSTQKALLECRRLSF